MVLSVHGKSMNDDEEEEDEKYDKTEDTETGSYFIVW